MEGLEVVPAGEDFRDAVHDFLLDHFRVTEPITGALGCSREDVFDFFLDLRDVAFNNPEVSMLVLDGTTLAAICLNSIKEYPEVESTIPWKFDPNKDYAEEISQGPYKSENANRLSVFIDTVEEDLQILTNGAKRIFKIDVLCVSRDYQKRGIGKWLVEESLRRAAAAGCEYLASTGSAVGSQAIFTKLGFETLRELPFSCFRENGQEVFRNLADGGRSGKLMGVRLQSHDQNGSKNVLDQAEEEDLR
ncbi:unnamed protein product [Caenorhabditis auriculariae]|uniref:aralkylamine N-acetyltransferase n=1 Tax=Caenorhabditis auriculariae TaxID=2777116 RepID=A0A8S1GTY5_9PELO|nr:unnamed protein product [Caenorhabditis auriculariae]